MKFIREARVVAILPTYRLKDKCNLGSNALKNRLTSLDEEKLKTLNSYADLERCLVTELNAKILEAW